MKTLVATLAFVAAGTAFAAPTCNQPKDQWQDPAAFRKNLESQGYAIKTFKVTKGNCYEIYGTDKAGKKVEIYFDPVTAAVLESK